MGLSQHTTKSGKHTSGKTTLYRKYPAVKKKTASEGQRYRLSPVVIRLTESDEGVHVPNRIQLFRTGTFKKLMPDGSSVTFSITKAHLEEMVQNWKNGVRGVDIAIDFAHKSDEEAAGWFKNLFIQEGDGESELWAEVDWTPDGYAAVGGKKFRYVSPDFAFSWIDNESGKRHGATLFGAGLTNRPVIKNMAPTVELTEVETMAKKVTKKKISEMTKEELELLLAEEKDEQKKELIQWRLDEMSEDDSSDDEDTDEDEDEDEGEDEGDADNADKTAGKQKKKAKPDMSFDELKAAYEKVCGELNDVKKSMVKQLAETQKKEKEARFAILCSEGKAVPAQKEAFLSGDMEKFLSLAQPVSYKAFGGQGAPVANTSAQDEVLKLAEQGVKDGKWKSVADGIGIVLSENPKLNERYEREMEGEETAAA